MNLIVCLDVNGGMSYFGRRQSMDRVLREKALSLADDGKLWMDAYSAGQFQNHLDRICVTRAPLQEVPTDGWFFMELGEAEAYLPGTDRLAVFYWNREYPADRSFPLDRVLAEAKLLQKEDFPGNSHETISLEVYQL